MAADPLKSAGARAERKAWVAKIKRMRSDVGTTTQGASTALDELDKFGTSRRTRYDSKSGGLGRKLGKKGAKKTSTKKMKKTKKKSTRKTKASGPRVVGLPQRRRTSVVKTDPKTGVATVVQGPSVMRTG